MICIPIKKEKYQEFLAEIKKAEPFADLLELWFDELKNLDEEKLKEIFSIIKKPILYKFQGNIENSKRIIKFDPQYIDVDIDCPENILEEIKKSSAKTEIMISYHNFDETPDDKSLMKIINKIYEMGGDIAKIAIMANKFEDSLRILKILEEINSKNKKIICIGMGEEGKITRETGHLFGNYLMYAPLTEKDKTASGQLTVDELVKIHA
jgi:3-dehydroquinate dehydratase-1